MRVIELDATGWATVLDFYHAILSAVGAPAWHGESIDALIDSMIWGGINAVSPPYTIRIRNIGALPSSVADHIELAERAFDKARIDFKKRRGRDAEVYLEVIR